MKKLSIASIVMTVLLLNTTSVSATPCGCSHDATCTIADGKSYTIKTPHPIKYTINGTTHYAECAASETHTYVVYKCSKCGSNETRKRTSYYHPSEHCPEKTY